MRYLWGGSLDLRPNANPVGELVSDKFYPFELSSAVSKLVMCIKAVFLLAITLHSNGGC